MLIIVAAPDTKLRALSVEDPEAREVMRARKPYASRWDWKDHAEVEALATKLTADTGRLYLGVDHGEHTAPRFDVVEGWKVGDPVSYAFNGDCYPAGTITRIAGGDKQTIVTTDKGERYYRRKLSATWKKTGGTWSLVHGHHYEQNPSF